VSRSGQRAKVGNVKRKRRPVREIYGGPRSRACCQKKKNDEEKKGVREKQGFLQKTWGRKSSLSRAECVGRKALIIGDGIEGGNVLINRFIWEREKKTGRATAHSPPLP